MVANQFEVARKRAEQQSRAGLQQQQEALKRRFASMGAVSSGARMKAEQVAAEKAQEQLQGAMEGIGAAEQQEQQRLAEIEQQRQFARSEREAGQKFAASEREAGQQFAGKQAELGRQFSIQERQAQEAFQASQADKNREFSERQFAWQQTQSGKELELAMQQFLMDRESTEFNKRMAIAKAAREGISEHELLGTTRQESAAPARPASVPPGTSPVGGPAITEAGKQKVMDIFLKIYEGQAPSQAILDSLSPAESNALHILTKGKFGRA